MARLLDVAHTKSPANKATRRMRLVTSDSQPALAAHLAAKARKRESLIASEKARLGATRLLDSDYDRIAGWLHEWERKQKVTR